MNVEISDQQLLPFGAFVADVTGLHFPESRWPDLRRAIAAAAAEAAVDDPLAWMRSLMSGPRRARDIQMLAAHLTVGETYFFREHASFEILANQILPVLVRKRRAGSRHLRFWSAACCTGEEAYSLAIVLRQTLPDLPEWNISILATDINRNYLKTAAAGNYGQWSFRETPPEIRQQYFREVAEGRFEILPEIKRMVRFAHLNLADDIYPSPLNDTDTVDVIFCRNVLMYFTPEQARKVVQKLYRAQADGGWMIVSASESPNLSFPPYKGVSFGMTTLLRKTPGQTVPREAAILDAHIASLKSGFTQNTTEALDAPPMVAVQPFQPIAADPTPVPRKTEPIADPCALAAALFEQGRYAEVVTGLENFLLARPWDPSAHRLVSRSLANLGKLADALESCNRWIAIDKLNASAHYLHAVILQEQGAIDEAVGSLRKAMYLNPDFVLAHVALGNIARERGEFRDGDKHLKNAAQLLNGYASDDVLPDSDGMTAGRFAEIIRSLISVEAT